MEYVYATAANGLTVRIPKDKYPQWKEAQSKLTPEQIAADKAAIAQLKAKLGKK